MKEFDITKLLNNPSISDSNLENSFFFRRKKTNDLYFSTNDLRIDLFVHNLSQYNHKLLFSFEAAEEIIGNFKTKNQVKSIDTDIEFIIKQAVSLCMKIEKSISSIEKHSFSDNVFYIYHNFSAIRNIANLIFNLSQTTRMTRSYKKQILNLITPCLDEKLIDSEVEDLLKSAIFFSFAARSAGGKSQSKIQNQSQIRMFLLKLIDGMDEEQLSICYDLVHDIDNRKSGKKQKKKKKFASPILNRESWRNRTDLKENPLDFIARVYPDRKEIGLTQAHLRAEDADPALYTALHNWLRGPKNGERRTIPADFGLPTKKAKNDELLAEASLDPKRPEARLYAVAAMRAARSPRRS